MKKSILMGMLLLSVFNQTANAQARFTELKEKFDSITGGGPETNVDMDYLGRCFGPKRDSPEGMILTSREGTEIVDADAGPAYPPRELSYQKLAFTQLATQLGTLPANSNDSANRDVIDQRFWRRNFSLVNKATVDENQYLGSNNFGNTFSVKVAIPRPEGSGDFSYKPDAAGAIFYGRITLNNAEIYYCYFYKKLGTPVPFSLGYKKP